MFEEARLENVGPIRRASIGAHRLTVFVGPNNSGKSIASRLIHAARRLGTSSGPPAGPDGAAAVLRGAGIEWPDAVTRPMPSGRLELGGGTAQAARCSTLGTAPRPAGPRHRHPALIPPPPPSAACTSPLGGQGLSSRSSLCCRQGEISQTPSCVHSRAAMAAGARSRMPSAQGRALAGRCPSTSSSSTALCSRRSRGG